MAKHKTLRLKPKSGRRAKAGAPWIFSNEIDMTAEAKTWPPGRLVNVAADERVLGTGYFNPGSLIGVRLLDPEKDAVIDKAFFARHFRRALTLRQALFDRPFYRLVHAEGDGLPGLTVDRFDDVCVAQVTTAGMEGLIPPMLEALEEVLAPRAVVLRNDAPSRALEGLESYVRAGIGEMPARISIEENGARYFADLQGGQKTGWYYDQREHRAFMASLAKGKSVLDAYCYAGGFAIQAAKAGARETIGIDSSQGALSLAEDAATANKVACSFVKADVLEELARLIAETQTFDIVIADPPPFVKARKDLEAGARAYRRLARLSASVTAKNGFLFLASCSHNIPMERFADECALGIARAGRKARLIRQGGAGPDHTVHPILPETAYLKALVYALD
ncbi:MAG TPA: class I SAM-dependent rRNA methyltransferase [Rhizomicrobium sp.]|nr:class I SAM-dependent rRNA methyltransferase [Rhizomicrobium sp.]